MSWKKKTDTRGKSHVNTEAEITVMHLQAKECQGLLAKKKKKEEESFPTGFRRKHDPTDRFGHFSLQKSENKFLFF